MALRLVAAVTGVLAATVAYGSGFALYEPSVISHAMGGALVGKAMDASANFNNPATLTDLTNAQITVGFVTEHPRCQVRGDMNGRHWGDECLDPGLFWLPHFQLALPLGDRFVFGLSGDAEYGLGTLYGNHWPMAWNSIDTTVQGYVLNPNLACRITDKWSVGVGLRWLFFDFEQWSRPSAQGLGTLRTRLKGNNRFLSCGLQVGTKYDLTDDFSIGAVYKSPIKVKVKGKVSTKVKAYDEEAIDAYSMREAAAQLAQMGFLPGMPGYSAALEQASVLANGTIHDTIAKSAYSHNGGAEAELTLPQSVAVGCNWDVTRTWHLGAALSWTEWSVIDTLHFDLAGGDKDTRLNWHDTWRFSVGSCWDFADGWKWMLSYTFDMDCTDSRQESTMLPPAHRHIAATGFAWEVGWGVELALSYSCIFMDGLGMDTYDTFGNRYHLETCRGFCHAAGFSVTYRF